MRNIWIVGFLFVSLLGVGSDVSAQVCEPKKPQEELQYLRRLSIDLRGILPSLAEARQVLKTGSVSEKMIDSFLRSSEFYNEVKEYHRDLLWARLQRFSFDGIWRLRGDGVKEALFNNDRASSVRGARIGCGDKAASKKSDGSWKVTCQTYKDPRSQKMMKVCKEGWIKIRPYWNSKVELKVCAYDGQANTTFDDGKGNRNKDCRFDGKNSKSCGCGPNLRWCQSDTFNTSPAITSSFSEQILRSAVRIVKKNLPYTEILLGREMEVNGPLSHFLMYQTHTVRNFFVRAEQNYKVPAVPYHEKENWTSIQRGKMHAGILTMPGFLLKFMSNRGRANRFYLSFLCRPFTAPAGGLPPGQDPCHNEPNLMKRCGCKYCHASLEPAAAHWGRWVESGLAALDSSKYPSYLKKCGGYEGANDRFCNRFYNTPRNIPDDPDVAAKNIGQLKAYLFATEGMKKSIENGPIMLAKESIQSGVFASCTVAKVWAWFVGNGKISTKLPSSLLSQFKQNKYDLKKLIKAIVMTREYREGQLHAPRRKK